MRESALVRMVLTPEKLSAAAMKGVEPKITCVVGVAVEAPRARQGDRDADPAAWVAISGATAMGGERSPDPRSCCSAFACSVGLVLGVP